MIGSIFSYSTLFLVPSLAASPSHGTTKTALYAYSQADKGFDYLRNSLVFGKSFLDLKQIFEDCSVANWDGYQGEPVSEKTYKLAEQFLKALPLGIPAPSVGAEPDGQLTLEWYQSPLFTLSLSIDPEGLIHYAALLGISKAYGTEPFIDEVPDAVMDLINRVFVT